MSNYSISSTGRADSNFEAKVAINKNLVKEYIKDGVRTVYLNNGTEFQLYFKNYYGCTVGVEIWFNNERISDRKIVLRPGEDCWLDRFIDTNDKLLYSTYMVSGSDDRTEKAIAHNGEILLKVYQKAPYRRTNVALRNPANITVADFDTFKNHTMHSTLGIINEVNSASYTAARGVKGIEGPRGIAGTPGDPGYCDGNICAKNLAGEQGVAGDRGPVGTKGDSAVFGIEADTVIEPIGHRDPVGPLGDPGTPFIGFCQTIESSACENMTSFASDVTALSADSASEVETLCAEVALNETGTVERGSQSDQVFEQVAMEFYAWPDTTQTIRILPNSQKPVTPSEIRRRYCSSCGRKVRPDDKFCYNCGAPLK